jgi:hypothetical protein
VIINRNTLSVRPPAFTISGLATASPARTTSGLTSNPCARNVPSVHPSGQPASMSSARRCSPPMARVGVFIATAPGNGGHGFHGPAGSGFHFTGVTARGVPLLELIQPEAVSLHRTGACNARPVRRLLPG